MPGKMSIDASFEDVLRTDSWINPNIFEPGSIVIITHKVMRKKDLVVFNHWHPDGACLDLDPGLFIVVFLPSFAREVNRRINFVMTLVPQDSWCLCAVLNLAICIAMTNRSERARWTVSR